MVKALRMDNSAPWKQRFRASRIFWTTIATQQPARGLVASNLPGIVQLYAWDVPTGTLTQLTQRPQGQVMGNLSPDGRYVYYHDDAEGNEIGHFVRLPFEGGCHLPHGLVLWELPHAAGPGQTPRSIGRGHGGNRHR